MFQASEADQRVAQQMNALNREYEDINKALPSFGVGGSTMRDAVTFYNGSIRGFPTLGDFVVPLSQVIRAHPNVRLSQLAWQATNDAKATPRIAIVPSRDAPPVKAVARSAEVAPPVGSDDNANPPFAGGRFEIAVIEATVRVSANDFRGAMAEVERLAADIGTVPGFQRRRGRQPARHEPVARAAGPARRAREPSMEPRFTLRIVRERQGSA